MMILDVNYDLLNSFKKLINEFTECILIKN